MNFLRSLLIVLKFVFKVVDKVTSEQENRLVLYLLISWWMLVFEGFTLPGGCIPTILFDWPFDFNFCCWTWNPVFVKVGYHNIWYGVGYLFVAFTAVAVGVDGALYGFCLIALMANGLPSKNIIPAAISVEMGGFIGASIGLLMVAFKIKEKTQKPLNEILALEYVCLCGFCAGAAALIGPFLTRFIPNIVLLIIMASIVFCLIVKGNKREILIEFEEIEEAEKDKINYRNELVIGITFYLLPMMAFAGGLLGSAIAVGFGEMMKFYFFNIYFKKDPEKRTLTLFNVQVITAINIAVIDTVTTSMNILLGNIKWDISLGIVLLGFPSAFFCGLYSAKYRRLAKEYAQVIFRFSLTLGLFGILYRIGMVTGFVGDYLNLFHKMDIYGKIALGTIPVCIFTTVAVWIKEREKQFLRIDT